jgi:hypothetical protein
MSLTLPARTRHRPQRVNRGAVMWLDGQLQAAVCIPAQQEELMTGFRRILRAGVPLIAPCGRHGRGDRALRPAAARGWSCDRGRATAAAVPVVAVAAMAEPPPLPG